MITTAIIYDHRKRTPIGKEGPVEVRVTINRNLYYINTGVRVTQDRFRKGGVIIDNDTSDDAKELNDRISIMYKKIATEINERMADGRSIDVADIRKHVCTVEDARSKCKCTVSEWIKSQEPLLNVSKGTLAHYATLRLRLDEFNEIRHWQDINVEMLYKWDAWLRGLHKKVTENQRRAGIKGELIDGATVYNYHKWMKVMINRAVRMGVIEKNPYDLLRGEFKRVEKESFEYLTREQMRAIVDMPLDAGSAMSFARDIFTFQMYTGLSYGDAQAFDAGQYKNIDGRWVLAGQRIKTGVPYVSMLLPPAVDVLERNGWMVPKMSNQKYNVVLKKIGERIGEPRLHSHMARHTFATWIMFDGASMQNVSKMLGHRKLSQTQRYAQVLPESVLADLKMYEEKIINENKTKEL